MARRSFDVVECDRNFDSLVRGSFDQRGVDLARRRQETIRKYVTPAVAAG